jgi:hypothetical protein
MERDVIEDFRMRPAVQEHNGHVVIAHHGAPAKFEELFEVEFFHPPGSRFSRIANGNAEVPDGS